MYYVFVSLVIAAVGAILRWGVADRAEGVDLSMIGLIVLIVGLVGLVFSMISMASRERARNRDVIVEEQVPVRERVERPI